MPPRTLPPPHPPIRRHINHMDLTLRRIQNLIPQPRVIDRERVGLERGRDNRRQVSVVAVIQNLAEFVLRPDGTGAALLQVVEDQHGGRLNFVEAAIKRNVRSGAEGLSHVVEQVGHFHKQGLSAQVNVIVADGRREVSLAAERTSQQHEPAYRRLRRALIVRKTFFDHLSALTRYMIFENWHDLLAFMEEALEISPYPP